MKTIYSKWFATVSWTKLSLVATGLFLATTSSALAQLPVITIQPVSEFLSPSATAIFSVSVSGAGPFAYQWLSNGVALAGARGNALRLSNLQPAASGYYSVIVTNASGSVTSQVAELKVFVPAPHKLSGIQVEPGGPVGLSFAGETTASFAPYYDLYPLATSSNLADWAPLVTLQRSNVALAPLGFLDTNASQFSQRFYRTPTNQLATPDAQPTGPYPVGTFSMELTNSRRSNAKFMVTFWYPTAAQAGVLPAKYVESQVALGQSLYNLAWAGGGNFSSQVSAFCSNSLSNAPVATNLANYPVVLYSPGLYSHRRDNTDKAEDLASWGYVVVGLDTADTYVSVFPDGTVVYGQTVSSGQIDAAIEQWLLDQEFVLDELQSLNARDPRLGGRLDLDKIGVFGWSLGGATAAQLCLRDPRCKAGAGMDGDFFETNVLTRPLQVPYLFLRSGDDSDGPYDDRWVFYNEQVTNAYWVKLVSTVHGNFADPGLIDDSGSLQDVWGLPISGQFLPPARVSQLVRAYLLSFFNKYLKGEDDHLLDGPSPAYPEVLQFLSTANLSGPPEYPSAGLVQGRDGNFYGTTAYGGNNGIDGTVFQMTPAGALTTLASFNGTNGSHPMSALVQGSDGNFYGTTACGGPNGNDGTVFQMTPAGALTTLASFNGTNGSYPTAGLVQGTDGSFFGTTLLGGAHNYGTVFNLSSAGALTTLVSFNGTNGIEPFSALVQGTNGNFYGTTLGDNASGDGTVFQMTAAGALTTLFTFSGTNGDSPVGLVQGTNDNFYGTTFYGGASGVGTVFQMTPVGALTTLVSFTGANGRNPMAVLVQGSDGNFYGTTLCGGASVGGTTFKVIPAGAVTTLVSFNRTNGSNPQAPLVQGNDGNFYGTTTYGGTNSLGTVFKMTLGGSLTNSFSFGGQTNAPGISFSRLR